MLHASRLRLTQRARGRCARERTGSRQRTLLPEVFEQEVAPKAGVVAGQYSLGNTIDNPQGNVAIDRCVRWDTNEPVGKSKDKPQKLILTPPQNDDTDSEDLPEGDS